MMMTIAAKPAMWGGRFAKPADPLFTEFNDSLAVDWALLQFDIEASIAWADALGAAGVLSPDEVARLTDELGKLSSEAHALPHPPLQSKAEDVHSWVEMQLIDRLGDLGKKLHTGRSRNDQVATDLRLWTRAALDEQLEQLHQLQSALVELAKQGASTPMPAYTHLQRAQPILLAHWCLAHVESLKRDAARLQGARMRLNQCPLGSAALAGTAYDIDRAALADSLDFDGPCANSIDGVADRDFVVEALAAASLCAVHLSRLAEDLIFYASAECNYVTLDDAVTSGSSIMPQKKNPDALELIRGKTGRIAAAHTNVLMMLKGQPLAYNKDLQEDKPPLFDAMTQLGLCLGMATRVVQSMSINREACAEAALAGYANATELADYLVNQGVPFRTAHKQVGALVQQAIDLSLPLEDLPIEAIQSTCPAAGPDVFDALTVESALARRDVIGGTAPTRVAEAIESEVTRLSNEV